MFSNLDKLLDGPIEAPLALAMGLALIITVAVRYLRSNRYPQSYIGLGSLTGAGLVFVGLDMNRVASTPSKFTTSNGALTITRAYPQLATVAAAVLITIGFVALLVDGVVRLQPMMAVSAMVGTCAMVVITTCALQYALRDDPQSFSWLSKVNLDGWLWLTISLLAYMVAAITSLILWALNRRAVPATQG